jgi:hypothetical protein
MSPTESRTRRRLAGGFALLAAFLSFAWFFPGDISDPDTVWQFRQSRTGEFHDTHPVAMALLWRGLNRVHEGPELMLLLQVALYWGAAYLVVRAGEEGPAPARAGYAAALAAAPYLTVFLGEIVKDVQMYSAWVFAASAAYALRSRGGWGSPVTCVGLLALAGYGALVRHNAAVVAGPMMVYLATGSPFRRTWARTAAAWALVGALGLGAAKLLPLAVGAPRSDHPEVLLMFDLVGISRLEGEDRLPLELAARDYDTLLARFDHSEAGYFFYGDQAHVMRRVLTEGPGRRGLLAHWLREVARAPGAYLEHRARYAWNFYLWRPDEPVLHRWKSVFSRPIAWLLALAVLVGVRLGPRRELEAPAAPYVDTLLLSAGLYGATYLVVGFSWGYRLFYPVPALLSFAAVALVTPGPYSSSPS